MTTARTALTLLAVLAGPMLAAPAAASDLGCDVDPSPSYCSGPSDQGDPDRDPVRSSDPDDPTFDLEYECALNNAPGWAVVHGECIPPAGEVEEVAPVDEVEVEAAAKVAEVEPSAGSEVVPTVTSAPAGDELPATGFGSVLLTGLSALLLSAGAAAVRFARAGEDLD